MSGAGFISSRRAGICRAGCWPKDLNLEIRHLTHAGVGLSPLHTCEGRPEYLSLKLFLYRWCLSQDYLIAILCPRSQNDAKRGRSTYNEMLNAVQEALIKTPVQDIISFYQFELLNTPPQLLQLLFSLVLSRVRGILKKHRDRFKWETSRFPLLHNGEEGP